MKPFSNSAELLQIEVADIFRQYGKAYRSKNGMTKKQHEVMYAIEHCRTPHYGFHADRCNECGNIEHEYNSCRDRHCPKCQGIARKKWVDKRIEDLLPVSYYHAVFSLPHLLHAFILFNRQLIYDLLFSNAAETLLTFGRDSKWLGGEIGFFGVLHTWGQTLWQHPHVHFIIAGGALDKDNQWIEPEYRNKFLFPAKALSKVFRGKFIAAFKKAYYSDHLTIPPYQSHLQTADNFERWIDRLVARKWVSYCKSPFEDAEQVVQYVGRYTHRVAMVNQRIIGIEDGKVRFWYKDYKTKKISWKQMRLDVEEFIHRFLWHVLPQRFHKIRHFGFLSNGRCKETVALIRRILANTGDETDKSQDKPTGRSCPNCGKGVLIPLFIKDGYGRIIASFSDICTDSFLLDTS